MLACTCNEKRKDQNHHKDTSSEDTTKTLTIFPPSAFGPACYEDSLKVAKDEVLKTKGREAKELKMAAVPPIGAIDSRVCPTAHTKCLAL